MFNINGVAEFKKVLISIFCGGRDMPTPRISLFVAYTGYYIQKWSISQQSLVLEVKYVLVKYNNLGIRIFW